MEKLRQFNTSGYIWETNNISIEGGEVKEISLDNSKPNMFVLQNANPVDINISLSHIPTLYNYEFQVKANTTDTFGRPSSTTKVYLFNTGSTTANVKLFSVNDTFDMNILKNTNVNIDGATVTVEDNGVIKGFQAGVSLPSGNNKIGKVGLEDSVSDTLTQINTNLNTHKTTTANINSTTLSTNTNIKNIARVLGVTKGCNIEYKNNVNSLTINNSNSSTSIVHFTYLFNDNCDVDIIVGNVTKLTIMKGEQLGDLEIEIPASQNLTIVKSSTATAEATVNIRCKYYTYISVNLSYLNLDAF